MVYKKIRVQFLKLQKHYSFSSMVFKTRKTVIAKYLIVFKTKVFPQNHDAFLKQQKYFASKQSISI